MAPRRPRKSTFSLDVRKFAEAAGADVEKVKKLATLQMFTDIVQNTPVDTGRAKGSWTVGNGSLPRSFRLRKDKSGSITIRNGVSKIEKSKPGESIFIASNLVYMPRLEYGYSQQAPHGMVRRAAQRFRRHMKNAVRQITGRAQSFRSFR